VVTTSEIDQQHALCDAALVRVFAVLGKRWNGLILGSLSGGPESFSSLSRIVRGISDSVLSERLSALAEAGLVVRTVCPGPPVAVIYELTTKGRALMPGLTELTRWAEQYPC
jgi:DNA-binding HxlR family transcriptional regulator